MRFGTDGIRGKAGVEITESLAFNIGNTVARVVGRVVCVARDSRPSSPGLCEAAIAGVVDAGGEAVDLGILPTPGLSWRVASSPARAGIMITASHNPVEDNGVKVVFGDGKKLSTGILAAISDQMDRTVHQEGGVRSADHDSAEAYVEAVLAALPTGRWLQGKRILFDPAMGAAQVAGRRVLERLGAEVVPFIGRAINDRCGAVHPQFAASNIKKLGCDAGIALDGDGDRVALIDRNGRILDGDALLWLLRQGPVMVGTVMTNLGLERALSDEGITLFRTGVGDALVAATMADMQAPIGGEPSGHLLIQGGCPTSDGLLVALLAMNRQPDLSTKGYTPFPQAHASLRDALKTEVDTSFITKAGGRAVIRRSGTEAVLRVMVEHRDATTANALRDSLVSLLQES